MAETTLSGITIDQALESLISSGKYKPKTEYLPKQVDDPTGIAALDLEAMLSKAEVDT